jgi:hypothetical protein
LPVGRIPLKTRGRDFEVSCSDIASIGSRGLPKEWSQIQSGDRRKARSIVPASSDALLLQLQIVVPEGAGGFIPLKTSAKLGVFRPGFM